MKMKIPLLLVIGILLVACSPKVVSTPANSLPSIQIETPTAISNQVLEKTPATSPTSSSQALSGEVEIEIEDFTFNPGTVTIALGTTIKWSNKDTSAHTITGDDGSWVSPSMNKGDDFFFTFAQAGTYTYHCSVHPSMVGTIVVVSP